MRDAMTSDSAVFEPEEVKILDVAFHLAAKRVGAKLVGRQDQAEGLARLVHNLGRSRLQLKKHLRNTADAQSLANEAAEVFSYLAEAPAAVVEAGRSHGKVKPRPMTIFPADLRMLPKTALQSS